MHYRRCLWCVSEIIHVLYSEKFLQVKISLKCYMITLEREKVLQFLFLHQQDPRTWQLTMPLHVTPLCWAFTSRKNLPSYQPPSGKAFLHQELWLSYPCRLGSLWPSPEQKTMKLISFVFSLHLRRAPHFSVVQQSNQKVKIHRSLFHSLE